MRKILHFVTFHKEMHTRIIVPIFVSHLIGKLDELKLSPREVQNQPREETNTTIDPQEFTMYHILGIIIYTTGFGVCVRHFLTCIRKEQRYEYL